MNLIQAVFKVLEIGSVIVFTSTSMLHFHMLSFEAGPSQHDRGVQEGRERQESKNIWSINVWAMAVGVKMKT